MHIELCPNVSAIHTYISADLVVGAYESQLVVLLRYERERVSCVLIILITSFCRSLPVITVFVNMRVDAPTPVALDSTYVHVHVDNNAVWRVSFEFLMKYLSLGVGEILKKFGDLNARHHGHAYITLNNYFTQFAIIWPKSHQNVPSIR